MEKGAQESEALSIATMMQNHRVSMIRHTLRDIPQHALTEGYTFRWYRSGDREMWVRIHERAERYTATTAEVYDAQFERNETELAQRQVFLLDAKGHEVGTATAWFNDDYHGQSWGRVHWVAIVPEHQGKGLAKPLLSTICNRFIELGHERCYLVTGTVRLPAIHLYLNYGFEPEIRTGDDRRVWEEALRQLKELRRK